MCAQFFHILHALLDACNGFLIIGLVVEIPEIVKIATSFLPGLKNLPVLGKIIPLFSAGEMNEAKVMEQLEADANKSAKVRTKLKDDNNKRVIKVKDALECVENGLSAKLSLAFLKGAMQVIVGTKANAFDTLWDPIARCMIEKALQQDNRRSKGKYVKTKDVPEEYSELVSLRRGKLHPFIPPGE
jgi:hypothetical protein